MLGELLTIPKFKGISGAMGARYLWFTDYRYMVDEPSWYEDEISHSDVISLISIILTIEDLEQKRIYQKLLCSVLNALKLPAKEVCDVFLVEDRTKLENYLKSKVVYYRQVDSEVEPSVGCFLFYFSNLFRMRQNGLNLVSTAPDGWLEGSYWGLPTYLEPPQRYYLDDLYKCRLGYNIIGIELFTKAMGNAKSLHPVLCNYLKQLDEIIWLHLFDKLPVPVKIKDVLNREDFPPEDLNWLW